MGSKITLSVLLSNQELYAGSKASQHRIPSPGLCGYISLRPAASSGRSSRGSHARTEAKLPNVKRCKASERVAASATPWPCVFRASAIHLLTGVTGSTMRMSAMIGTRDLRNASDQNRPGGNEEAGRQQEVPYADNLRPDYRHLEHEAVDEAGKDHLVLWQQD